MANSKLDRSETGGADPERKLYQVAGTYRERLPVTALREHVDRVWSNELSQPAQLEVVPDGCMDIYWTGEELRVAGPNTNIVTATISRPGTLVGIRFKPGIAVEWLRTSAAELVNTHPGLDEFWGPRLTRRLAETVAEATTQSAAAAALERAVLDRLDRIGQPHPIVRATVAAATLPDQSSTGIVRSILDDIGCSERTLRRRCHEAFGYGPKTLQRILRFQRFLGMLDRPHPARLSLLSIEAGYSDQAHLAREVRRLCGMSPRSLMAELSS